jgi:transcriptional regulator with XRE-family HTH domain
MAKKKPRRKTPHLESRRILAENVKTRMDRMFPHVGDKPSALSKKSGASLSRIQDALNQTAGVSIDIIGRLAGAFGCTVSDLLTDDEKNRPEIVSLWSETDDFGQSNILQTARAWHSARPRGKPDSP